MIDESEYIGYLLFERDRDVVIYNKVPKGIRQLYSWLTFKRYEGVVSYRQDEKSRVIGLKNDNTWHFICTLEDVPKIITKLETKKELKKVKGRKNGN
jgi:hypothetical protein